MSKNDDLRRTILPIPDEQHVGYTALDAKDPDAKYPPIEPLRPPTGAPNVLIVLIDDCGFGASSAFGGPIHTPNAARLAESGLKLTRFHTTALCSPKNAEKRAFVTVASSMRKRATVPRAPVPRRPRGSLGRRRCP